jgi:hypothetical protein
MHSEEQDIEELQSQLKAYREERERIKILMGSIGGKSDIKRDKTVNWIFFVSIIILFGFDILRHILHLDIPLPPLISLEIGILLVSIKIIWMIHRQSKVDHFQFWILNSIEYRINNLGKQINDIQKKLRDGSETK